MKIVIFVTLFLPIFCTSILNAGNDAINLQYSKNSTELHAANTDTNTNQNSAIIVKNTTLTNKDVCYKMRGGLGNQMFEFATAYALAKRKGGQVFMDLSRFKTEKRTYALAIFNIPENFIDIDSNPRDFYEHYGTDETVFTLTNLKSLLKTDKPVILEPLFMCPLYFNNVTDDLREMFTLKIPLSDNNQVWLNKIKSCEKSVSLHVRRSDYLDYKGVFSICSIKYYKRAVNLIRKILGKDVTFFIFSEDIDDAKKSLSWLKNAEFVPPDPKNSHEDMILMSNCKHNIIANSTYSWWGAWLNKNPDKIVIAPNYYFTRDLQAKINTIDWFDREWIILNSNDDDVED